MRSQVRLGKGSQQIGKSITERLIRSVQNPYEGMQFVPPTNDIPCGELAMRIGSGWLVQGGRARTGNDPLPPPAPTLYRGVPHTIFPPLF